MIPELIISGEDAKGEFLMSVPRKMLLCSFCVMTMKQDRKIRRLKKPPPSEPESPLKLSCNINAP